MSSIVLLTFNLVGLQAGIAIINSNPWMHSRKAYRALKYGGSVSEFLQNIHTDLQTY